jgi:hypothetical protein
MFERHEATAARVAHLPPLAHHDPTPAASSKRLDPQDLRDSNGRHAVGEFPSGADRRAWTWEARTPDPISYDDAIRALTTRATLEAAIDAFADRPARAVAVADYDRRSWRTLRLVPHAGSMD